MITEPYPFFASPLLLLLSFLLLFLDQFDHDILTLKFTMMGA